MTAHCHKMIRRIAQEAAAELYETLMSNNEIRAEWKRQYPNRTERELVSAFVGKNWGKCIPVARATLAHLLTTHISETLKADIMDALVKDATLMRGRANGMTKVIGAIREGGRA